MKLSRPILAVLCVVLCWSAAGSALDRSSGADYHARRAALAGKLNGGVAVLFAGEEPLLDFMPYRQDSDFYYLTGWNEPGAALLIEAPAAAQGTRPARAYREVMFLPTRNLRMELFTGRKLDAASPDAPRLTGVDEVRPMSDLAVILNQIAAGDRTMMYRVWSEPETEQAKSLLAWTAATLGMEHAPPMKDVRGAVAELRAVKDADELMLLRKAADASVQAQLAMMKAVHPGQRERTVAGIILEKLMENGCERPSYAPIVGSGEKSTELHYAENSQTMQAGDVVVVDAAGEYSMYASDITRTLPVNGHFSARQREIYDIVLGAQRAAMEAFVAGKSRINDPQHKYPDSLDTIAWNYMNAHGKDLHGDPLGKYFIHGIGHSVGIDVHDPYDYSQPIQKGMVFTIEPGIYIPEEKLGVRIEDVFYVKQDGTLECLTCALPKEAEAVEKEMRSR
ncbi:aminopeptidase P N-terminal domain-containing protein [Pseudacidobacterium ailaaui]|uniref:aminopeptidase P N-terminal domain-containing protein n=1 Tax=Pseudacidobacterium ailaaui TaxID=1382359 RepID=UPI00047CA07F|nr:aminopeptidase P N-terminal domain-containing protein [Pseudacidobacterium ailaaui]MBX6360432.1 aminopeptidase P N-terminal domain-containing protein [Pseudacidobacterium ailaaui]MCL6462950.1 aminopeptidase P N-terminal domain-containing protein [Pseudacidobacterium ailaaui]